MTSSRPWSACSSRSSKRSSPARPRSGRSSGCPAWVPSPAAWCRTARSPEARRCASSVRGRSSGRARSARCAASRRMCGRCRPASSAASDSRTSRTSSRATSSRRSTSRRSPAAGPSRGIVHLPLLLHLPLLQRGRRQGWATLLPSGLGEPGRETARDRWSRAVLRFSGWCCSGAGGQERRRRCRTSRVPATRSTMPIRTGTRTDEPV